MSETTKTSTLSKILLRIVFIIAIIIAVALLAITLIRFTPGFFSYIGTASASLFNVFKKESLQIEVSPQTVLSEEKVLITWPTAKQESVALSYVCSNDYSLAYLGGSNTKMPIPCGKDFELGGTTGSATLIPTLKANDSFNDIEVFVYQTRTDDTTAEGSAVITVTSGTRPAATATTTPALTSTTTTVTTVKPATEKPPRTGGPNIVTTPTYTGPADLVVSQPVFINGTIPSVQFTISNIGGLAANGWNIEATLPNGQTFNSGNQYIGAGASVLYTLSIGSVSNGTYTVRVTADSYNAVAESNENNNKQEVLFVVGNGNGNGNNNTTSGKADLIPRVLSIGYIGSDIGIRFEIKNQGGTTAKDWRFEAELPNEDRDTFKSTEQPDLKPGEVMEYTLRFDNPRSNGYATIDVDSEDEVNESSESNNDIRFRVTN